MYGRQSYITSMAPWYVYFSGARAQECNRFAPRTHSSVQQPLPNGRQLMAISRSITRHAGPLGYQCYSFSLCRIHCIPLILVASRRLFGYGAGSLPNSFHQPTRSRSQGSRLHLQGYIRGWERLDNRSINEGPQFLPMPEYTGIVYSACGSWTNKYKSRRVTAGSVGFHVSSFMAQVEESVDHAVLDTSRRYQLAQASRDTT